MKTLKLKLKQLPVGFLSACLLAAPSVFADDSALPTEPQAQSPATQSVQPEVDAQASDSTAEKRQKLLADAVNALGETQNALDLLGEKKHDEAIEALARATGKLELIVARDPALALAPVDVAVLTHDLLASPDTVKTLVKEATELLEEGKVQAARPLVRELASEMVISTTNIPLATYPDAIKAITPLIDAGKIDEAKTALQLALNTLVITNEVLPLPVLRATALLEAAEALAETKDRTEQDKKSLAGLLDEARNQLQLAEVLGYGKKANYKPMYEQIKTIEKQTEGGKSGSGWFDKIKQQVSDLMN